MLVNLDLSEINAENVAGWIGFYIYQKKREE